jgi:hypothetical protein
MASLNRCIHSLAQFALSYLDRGTLIAQKSDITNGTAEASLQANAKTVLRF